MCLDKAKEEGLPLVVYSEPQLYRFFLKMGFQDFDHADMDLRQWAEEFEGFGVFRLSGMVVRN